MPVCLPSLCVESAAPQILWLPFYFDLGSRFRVCLYQLISYPAWDESFNTSEVQIPQNRSKVCIPFGACESCVSWARGAQGGGAGARDSRPALKPLITWRRDSRAFPTAPEVHGECAAPLGQPFQNE